MKFFNYFIFHIVCGFVVFGTVFFIFYKNVFCAETMLLNEAIEAALAIGSEYLVSRNGQTINNSASDNISDGELGSLNVKTDYADVISSALDQALPNVNDVISTARDFDVSNLSQSELAKFNQLVLGDDNLSGNNVFFKQATINGITMYWAVNQAGQWIGSSINNIAIKATPNSQTLKDNIDSVLTTDYRYDNLVFVSSFNPSVRSTDISVNAPLYYNLNFNRKYYLYSSDHILRVILPSSEYENRLGNLGSIISTNSGTVLDSGIIISRQTSSSSYFVINDVMYVDCPVAIIGNYTNSVYVETDFSSSAYIRTKILQNGYLGDVVYADLKDLSTDQGYTVPDIRDNTVNLGDVYNAIQHLEDALIGINYGQDQTVDGLSSGLTDAQIQSITDAITQAITGGLDLPDNEEEEDPVYELPIGIFPSFFPDLIPDDMFSMFQPVFDIVGTNYSMYGLWVIIPSILIFILVLYLIVSIF